jgi:ribosomal protein S18 acetylase RimI-like enzyme
MDGSSGARTVARRHRVLGELRSFRRIAGEVVRREGVWRLVVRTSYAVAGVVYRSVAIRGRDLTVPLPARRPSPDDAVEMRILTSDDAEALARHRADLEPRRIADRVARLGSDQLCVAAWLEDEIASTVWVAFGSAWLPELRRAIRLQPHEVFLYDSYTSERLRGRGIATMRALWTAEYLREGGYRFAFGHTAPENQPAQGPPEKTGYEVLATAGYVRLGPWRRDFVRLPDGVRSWARRTEPIVSETLVGARPAERQR